MAESLPNYTLNYRWDEPNPWFSSIRAFNKCYERYFDVFKSSKDWQTELQRSDAHTVCKKELEDLRKAAPGISYKEVLGENPLFFAHTQD